MTLSNEDRLALRDFLEQARHLESHSLIEGRQLRAKWKLTLTKGEEATEETHKVDYEALESILVRLRRFAMNNEAVFLPKVVLEPIRITGGGFPYTLNGAPFVRFGQAPRSVYG